MQNKFFHLRGFALGIPLFFVAFFPGNLMAESLSSRDISGLQKVEMAQHVLYETYIATDNGPAGVLGYYFDRYFSKDGYVSLAILGAVSGGRGGYGFAAVGLGHRWKLAPALTFDLRALVGSGGGGGVPAGGGLGVETVAALRYQITPQASLDAGLGQLTFLSGTLNTTVIQVGLSYQFYSVILPFDAQ
jgi:hypothetical protein